MNISHMARQVLQTLRHNGPMLKAELKDAGIGDGAFPLQRCLSGLSKSKCVQSVMLAPNIYQYSITLKGKSVLAFCDEATIEVRQATPSRIYCNASVRDVYRTGDGRARVGLAMIGV